MANHRVETLTLGPSKISKMERLGRLWERACEGLGANRASLLVSERVVVDS